MPPPRIAPAFLACLLLPSPGARAEAPKPVSVFPGQVRTFSPDGRWAVAIHGNSLVVYDTATWKGSPALPLDGMKHSADGVLVDNQRRVGATYLHETLGKVLDLLDFSGTPARLLREAAGAAPGPALSYSPSGEICIHRVAAFPNPPERRKKSGGEVFYLDSDFFYPFTCSVPQYLFWAQKTGWNLNRSHEAQLKETSEFWSEWKGPYASYACIYTPGTEGHHRFSFEQSDFAISMGMVYSTNGGFNYPFPRQPNERRSESWTEIIPGRVRYEPQKRSSGSLEKLSTPSFELVSGAPWRVVPKASGLPPFDLVQLEAPEFFPSRISPDGSLVALSNGRETRIYPSEVVLDPYANLDRDLLQDLLMQKIVTHIKADRPAEALPYFQRLEQTALPLPESFYFYQMEALEKSGRKADARAKADAYLARTGKKGKYYSKVIALMARL